MAAAPTVLFDLDGTLSDSAAGILASLRHACAELGVAPLPDEELRRAIGPPLPAFFAGRLGLGDEACRRAVAAYRERYVGGGGMLEAAPFPGVPELLGRLQARGARLAVATSKPAPFARRVLDHLGIAGQFCAVFGGDLAGGGDKAEVVGAACLELGLGPGEAVMVGDREDDVTGAAAHGLACLAVLWGYGSRAELEAAGASAVVATVAELEAALLAALAREGAGEG